MNVDLARACTRLDLQHQDHRVPGYKNRTFTPGALLVHHTASNRANPMMNHRLYTHGREGLPGPIVQAGLGRDNAILLFTDGYANHAGKASQQAVEEAIAGNTVARTARARGLKDTRLYSANRRLIGIEVDLDGIGEPLGKPRYTRLVDLCAAICIDMGWTAGHVTTHQYITARKIDLYAPDFPAWGTFQADIDQRIEAHMTGTPPNVPATPTPKVLPTLAQPLTLIDRASDPKTGGEWWLIEDGGIANVGGAPYFGHLLDPTTRQILTEQLDITNPADLNYHGQPIAIRHNPAPYGYTIFTDRNASYTFHSGTTR